MQNSRIVDNDVCSNTFEKHGKVGKMRKIYKRNLRQRRFGKNAYTAASPLSIAAIDRILPIEREKRIRAFF
jgi:hypothetical protein